MAGVLTLHGDPSTLAFCPVTTGTDTSASGDPE